MGFQYKIVFPKYLQIRSITGEVRITARLAKMSVSWLALLHLFNLNMIPPGIVVGTSSLEEIENAPTELSTKKLEQVHGVNLKELRKGVFSDGSMVEKYAKVYH